LRERFTAGAVALLCDEFDQHRKTDNTITGQHPGQGSEAPQFDIGHRFGALGRMFEPKLKAGEDGGTHQWLNRLSPIPLAVSAVRCSGLALSHLKLRMAEADASR